MHPIRHPLFAVLPQSGEMILHSLICSYIEGIQVHLEDRLDCREIECRKVEQVERWRTANRILLLCSN